MPRLKSMSLRLYCRSISLRSISSRSVSHALADRQHATSCTRSASRGRRCSETRRDEQHVVAADEVAGGAEPQAVEVVVARLASFSM